MTSRTGAWPWPADSQLDRARRVAQTYRAALATRDADAADQIDDWAAQHGQSWIRPMEWPYADDELLTAGQVADLFAIETTTVYRWHQRGLPYTTTVDGPRILVSDLMEWGKARRQARIR